MTAAHKIQPALALSAAPETLTGGGAVQLKLTAQNHTHSAYLLGYDDGTFRPDALITRAEAVQAINRVLARRADTDYIDQHTQTLNEYSDLPSTYWAYYEILEASLEHKYTLAENQEQWQ